MTKGSGDARPPMNIDMLIVRKNAIRKSSSREALYSSSQVQRPQQLRCSASAPALSLRGGSTNGTRGASKNATWNTGGIPKTKLSKSAAWDLLK